MRPAAHHALVLLLAPIVPAQSWTQITTAANPGALRDAAAAFHVSTGHTVLFGGWPTLNTTWLFDGTNWTAATPSTVPPARREAAMAFDFVRGRTVMFGGQGATGRLNDTWEWDGTSWTPVATATTPPVRTTHSMAFDALRGRVVMFGGTGNPNLPSTLTDTWEYDGSNWTQVVTAHAPSEAEQTAMCFDLQRGVCVLYGGTSFFGAPDQKTWEYDGVDWIDRTPAVGLGPTATPGLGLMNARMVYDPLRGHAILHGGRTPNGTYPPETWVYDGGSWVMVSSGTPSSRTGFQMAMDINRDAVVLYGGSHGNLQTNYNETWQFQGASVASFAVYGTGCMGSGGLPILTAQGSSLPRSASTFDTQVINLPAGGGFAFMVLGFDNTSWNGLPLPLDLTSFGMPGCTGYVRVDAAVLVPQVSGTLSFSMAIPGGLEGIVFHQQCLSLDPAAGNPAGAATSNAGTAVVGN
ncbi:MAG: hypothetical protein H6838_11945 [Planctomycetes bacterium]|nr:hypothetical protein [Planctomycetota bacterium]MCB9886199.1 hypothetical protein [Planctomycetota bacterium]